MKKGIKIFFENNRWQALFLILVIAVNVAVSFLISQYTKSFIDTSTNIKDGRAIAEIFAVIAIIYGILFIIDTLISFLAHRLLYSGIKNLRLTMFKKIMETKFTYFIDNSPGKIWGDIINNTNKASVFYQALILLPISLIQAVVYFVIIYRINTSSALVTLMTLPFIILATYFFGIKIRKHEAKTMSMYREMYGDSVEALTGIKNIKLFNSHGFFYDRFISKHSSLNKEIVSTAVYTQSWQSFLKVVTNLLPLIIIVLGVNFVKEFNLGSGDMVILYTFIPLFVSATKDLYSFILSFFGMKPYMQLINSILSLENEDCGNIKELNGFDVQTNGVSYGFKGKTVQIPDISIGKGEKILITGESGIGKSTFFNCLTGILQDYGGSIKVSGTEQKNISLKYLRDKIILLNQDRIVFDGTVDENLFFGKPYTDVNKVENIMRIVHLEKFYSDRKDGKKISKETISGGEKARLNLAQALLKNPEIILLDEVLSSVDEDMEKEILQNIITAYPKLSVVMITHRMSCRDMFDKVYDFHYESTAK
jgi:ABC-type bacteriocin/lantibiotic exporter with double-glycine peptidase domain